jgi:hypothetical protein
MLVVIARCDVCEVAAGGWPTAVEARLEEACTESGTTSLKATNIHQHDVGTRKGD